MVPGKLDNMAMHRGCADRVRRPGWDDRCDVCVRLVDAGSITMTAANRATPYSGTEMTVQLTDAQYGAVARALVAIAAGARFSPNGSRHNITRDELRNLAREACGEINLSYYGDGSLTPNFPEEIGFQFYKKPSKHSPPRPIQGKE